MSTVRATNAPSIYRPGLFDGKVALVTGGGSGIGKCISHELASLGCLVVIAARNADRLEASAKELRKDVANLLGRNCDEMIDTVTCDIRDEKQVKEMVKSILSKHQRIDFLVNNAGGQFRAPAEDISKKGFEAVVRLNLMGTFIVTKEVYHSYMREHGGSIVNIIIVLERGTPWFVHSGAARAGVENMTKSLAVEWAPSGIRLNCVAPGIILSSGIDNYGGDASLFHESANILTVAKRVGSVEEIAAATIYFLSPASAYTTGTTLCVDGGWNVYGSMLEVPFHDKTPVYGTRFLTSQKFEFLITLTKNMTLCRDPQSPSIYRPGLHDGKVALVTGGGTGIGKCIAHELASLGCTVVIAARNGERLEAAAKSLRADLARRVGKNVDYLIHAIVCDIRNPEHVTNMVEETLKLFKRIDFLVNNAGGQFRATIDKVNVKGWEAIMRTNLTGTFRVTKEVYHAYMKEHGGSIVNIILVIGNGYPLMAHSAAARAGIQNLSKSLSVEWASSGIRLNCVAPGIILSSGASNYEGGERIFHETAKKVTPAKRVGSVEEVSAAVLYYLSPAAAYTTGTTMHVDGGWHLLGPAFEVPIHHNTPEYGTLGNPTTSKL